MTPLTNRQLRDRFEDMLNEVHGMVHICGYDYEAARALKEVDPVAYRVAFADWLSSALEDELVEINGEYFNKDEMEESNG